MGDHGGRHRWWHPLRVLLALTTLALALGMLHQVPCERGAWGSSEDAQQARLCSSGIANAWVEEGLVELGWPLTGDEPSQRRFGASELPLLTATWAWGLAHLTHAVTGSPDTEARSGRPLDELAERDDVRREVRVFMALNAIGLAALALLATGLLVGAASRRRRPWDAAAWAASPLLVLTWLTGWTVLPAALLAAALAAWLAGRRVLAAALGVLVGLALVPWHGFLDPGLGSVWLAVEQATGASFGPGRVLAVSGVLLAGWCVVVALLLRRVTGRATHHGSRAALAVVLVGVGALAVSPQAPPAWSLVLLPAAALAAPRWRDLLVWQVGELVALLLTGLYLGDYLAPSGGGPAVAYWVAIALRIAAQAWLATAVLSRPPERDQSIRTSSNAVAV